MQELAKFFEFIKYHLNQIIPIAVVYAFQKGIMLKYGKFLKRLDPGWYFKFPYVNVVMVEQSVDTTMLLPAQSIITLDKRQLIIRGSVGYRIIDIADFYLNVWDTRSALADRTCVAIKEAIAMHNFDDCLGDKLDNEFLRPVKRFAKNYGIEVFYVSLTDITESKSFRLFNDQNVLN